MKYYLLLTVLCFSVQSFAQLTVFNSNDKWGLKDKKGSVVTQPVYDTIVLLSSYHIFYNAEEEWPVQEKTVQATLYLAFKDGEIIYYQSVDTVYVQDPRTAEYYITLDTLTHSYFSNGFIDVYDLNGSKIKPGISSTYMKIGNNDFINVFMPNKLFSSTSPEIDTEFPICLKSEGKWGAVNHIGQTLLPFQYDDLQIVPGKPGYILVVHDQKITVFTPEFKEVTPNVKDNSREDFISLNDYSNTAFAGWLIAHGADVNKKADYDGRVPLHAAVASGNNDLVRLLLENGAKVNALDIEQISVWQSANDYEIVEMLLKYGADPNEQDYFGQTALHRAVEDGKLQLVQLLIDSGADVNIESGEGKTPLDYARESEYEEIIKILNHR